MGARLKLLVGPRRVSGQLGHGDEVSEQLTPRRVEALAGERVVRIDASRWHVGISAATTGEGAVFMFGWGDNRALGLEDEEDRNLPTRVAALPTPYTGAILLDLALGGEPGKAWSVAAMKGGVAGPCLYRWGCLHWLNGGDPGSQDGDAGIGQPVSRAPWAMT